MLSIQSFFINDTAKEQSGSFVCGFMNPVFSWKLQAGKQNEKQTSFRLSVDDGHVITWESGDICSEEQSLKYEGPRLKNGIHYNAKLYVTGDDGKESLPYTIGFYVFSRDINFPWISSGEFHNREVLRFKKKFSLKRKVSRAYAVYCGLGYCTFMVDGKYVQKALLDPSTSDYTKVCYYTFNNFSDCYPEIVDNTEFCFEVADGWRNIDSDFVRGFGVDINFNGEKMVSGFIKLIYDNGDNEIIMTDDSWTVDDSSPITMANLFDGEDFDANKTETFKIPAVIVDCPTEKCVLSPIPPIMAEKEYEPKSIWRLEKDGVEEFVVDFGQNIAGVVKFEIPANLGSKVVVSHAEELDEDGFLYTAPLRKAKATDSYIPNGEKTIWQPRYTYHGFRYASIKGLPYDSVRKVKAVLIKSNIEQTGDFVCGSGLLNKIHEACVMTEKDNMHSILTDCPQRDERQGWMNDATVRFETMPYNFEVSQIFKKVVDDIISVQGEGGEITCTAPKVFGCRPADPVCSSYLVAALECYRRTGNKSFIRSRLKNLIAWEDFLLSKSDDYIVNYSYYGDWAGPIAACVTDEFACSAVTPGVFMSTGYSYYNCITIAKLAQELGKMAVAKKYTVIANKIKKAFLKKWFVSRSCYVATNSQATYAFALWLGLIPERFTGRVAKRMNDLVVKNNYIITTGNLCTRYLLEMLSKYGYVDTAYKVMTNEKYPSFGYMLQNEATTIWERFELKKNPDMNSHNHPMFASVDRWFYASILGINPLSLDGTHYEVKPKMPKDLLSAQGYTETRFGKLTVRWAKRYDRNVLIVTVPVGLTVDIEFCGVSETVGSGSYVYNV